MGGEYSKGDNAASNTSLVRSNLMDSIFGMSTIDQFDYAADVVTTGIVNTIMSYYVVRTVLLGWEFANQHEYTLDNMVNAANIGFYRSAPRDCISWPDHARYVCIRLREDIQWGLDNADAIVVGHCCKSLFAVSPFRENQKAIMDSWSNYRLPTLTRNSSNGGVWCVCDDVEYQSLFSGDAEYSNLINWISHTGQKVKWTSTMLREFELVLAGHSHEKEEELKEAYGADVRKQCYLCQQQIVPRSGYTTTRGHCKSCWKFVCGNHLAAENNLCDECDQTAEQFKTPHIKRRRITRWPLRSQ
jgi:hypothetical protein